MDFEVTISKLKVNTTVDIERKIPSTQYPHCFFMQYLVKSSPISVLPHFVLKGNERARTGTS